MAEQLEDIKKGEQENIEQLLRGGEMLRLYGKGVIAVERTSPRSAKDAKDAEDVQKYLDQVRSKFGIDLRAIGEGANAPEIDYTKWKKIAYITPPAVIRKANGQVTKPGKTEMDQRVREEAAKRMELLDLQKDGVPNSRFDGRSY